MSAGAATNLALVALGGALGSAARYGVGLLALRFVHSPGGEGWRAFPFATLAVNVLGCFAGGLLLGGRLAGRGQDDPARALLITGVLGGLTTFSAFGIETIVLAQQGRAGLAGLNVAANVLLGLSAAALGAWVARG